MKKHTLDQLEAAFRAIRSDFAPRAEELARRSTDGALTPEEHQEFSELVRLNDLLSLLKLETEAFCTVRAAS
jgi:hypothetical protein